MHALKIFDIDVQGQTWSFCCYYALIGLGASNTSSTITVRTAIM
jgi:hypothetical protein